MPELSSELRDFWQRLRERADALMLVLGEIGHHAGDLALRHVVAVMQQQMESTD